MNNVPAAEFHDMLAVVAETDLFEETEEALEYQRATIRALSAELRELRKENGRLKGAVRIVRTGA